MEFVTCKLIGPSEIGGIHYFGLANQMFQIATTLSYAKDNSLKAVFPELKNKKYGSYTNNIFRKLNTEEYDEKSIEVEFTQPDFRYTKIPVSKNIRLSGYFQSEKFFRHNRELIINSFEPQKETLEYIKKKYNTLLDDSIAVHLRFGDYKKIQDHHPLISKTNYYENILEKNNRTNILIFSDEINKAKRVKAFKKKSVHFIDGETEIVDLFLMSMCSDNAIANSSFSWWSAWLSNNAEKTIYYPEVWFGPAKNDFNTKDLIPESWIKVESSKIKKIFYF